MLRKRYGEEGKVLYTESRGEPAGYAIAYTDGFRLLHLPGLLAPWPGRRQISIDLDSQGYRK